ncbi:MAG: MATE family efflux transporter [Lachnospiraceae bacterium]|nr:MATE family efflux transporter [Lachnospiraceae bacterium]
MLVSSLYNIVDQFFIGRSIGELGNAATNIAFPLSISCVAVALLFGIGGSSAFNIAEGEGKGKIAPYYMGNAAVVMMLGGIVLTLITELFTGGLLNFFGSPAKVLPYALTYTKVVGFGFPFLIIATGGGHLVRADGRPKMTMIINMTGALLNVVLDALFVFVFQWGMAGAALATVIGQVVSGCMAIYFLIHAKSVTITLDHFKIQSRYVGRIVSLGMAPCTNQLAMMVLQIVMNKSLKYYGSMSVYGDSIPIACAGIITKVNQVFFAFIIGISQGLQPIVSFNYGARNYKRVKEAVLLASKIGFGLSVVAFCLFHFAPRQIIAIFGEGSKEYYDFAVNYFKIFLFFTFLNFLQPIVSNLFTAIGKPKVGMFLSLTRQILYLLPLMLILPVFMGIHGIMYSGAVADALAGVTTIVMLIRELSRDEYKASDNS